MRVWVSGRRRQGHVIFLALVFSVLGSCGGKTGEHPVIPPATPPLSRPVIGYGVVNVSYTYVVEEPGEGGVSPAYLRRGSLVRVLERRVMKTADDAAEVWVLVEGRPPQEQYRGWLKETVVDIYENTFQADTAAESMTQ
jgi:hypothetical protein